MVQQNLLPIQRTNNTAIPNTLDNFLPYCGFEITDVTKSTPKLSFFFATLMKGIMSYHKQLIFKNHFDNSHDTPTYICFLKELLSCVCTQVQGCHSTCVEARGHLLGGWVLSFHLGGQGLPCFSVLHDCVCVCWPMNF